MRRFRHIKMFWQIELQLKWYRLGAVTNQIVPEREHATDPLQTPKILDKIQPAYFRFQNYYIIAGCVLCGTVEGERWTSHRDVGLLK